jgi:hypothetical protein
MPTPIVDLSALNQAAEIIIRAGDPHAPNAKARMLEAYEEVDTTTYPDTVGLSTVFRQGDIRRAGPRGTL